MTLSLKKENHRGRRYLLYVFTEQGIAMLSGLLKNDMVIQEDINIKDNLQHWQVFFIDKQI